MVLSLGGGEGCARVSAEDNGSPGHFIKGSRFRALMARHLLQGTTAHHRRQKTHSLLHKY